MAFVTEQGLFYGTSETEFSPNSTMTRGMLATVLYRAAGSPEAPELSGFTDVQPDAYYAGAVAWAAENNIAGGYGNGSFGPNDPITREQLAVLLYRYAGSPEPPELALDFTDAGRISGYAQDAMRWAVGQGILRGKEENRLDPGGTATRAEVAAVLMRYLQE